ncbi:MAG: hypothetical protein PGN29_08750 [Gordonia paraffinivorans]
MGLTDIAGQLGDANGSGGFSSGKAIDNALQIIGRFARDAAEKLRQAVEAYLDSVVDAGNLIRQQEGENRQRIAKAGSGQSSDPLGIGELLSGGQSPVAVPDGPNPADIITSGMSSGLPSLPSSTGDAAGRFACGASPESVGGLTLDACVANLSPAEASRLTMLAQQWQQLGADLTSSITLFHNIVQSKMATGGWTGSSGKAVGDAAHKLVSTSVEIAAQANANGAAIVGWAGALGDTKSYIDSLAAAKGPAMAAAPPESQATVQNQIDTMARLKMVSTYNPGVAAISSSLSNLSDPSANQTGVPLVLAGMGGSGGSGGAGGGAGTSAASSGGGGGASGSGGGGGGGSTTARTGSDAAGQLARQGTGNPVSNATKNASSQGGQNTAAAAQQAVSKASDGAKSLGGSRSGAGSMTRPSGVGALSEAERNAAKAAAGGLKGAGGGGGAGKLGGAGGLGGAAAAESALSRNSSSLSAAEKALAGQQGATASRAASPAAGGPMGARGAGAKGDEDKEHRAAKYLKHAENGEEIAGDLPDTAPPVLGGLNLDTTDDTETSSTPADRR